MTKESINQKKFGRIPPILLVVGIVLVVIIVIGLSGAGNVHAPIQNTEKFNKTSANYVTLKGKTITIDIADTPASRTQGLSGRNSLSRDQGMLFVFEIPAQYGFWMKDMNFPIDIIWINEAKNIVHIEKNLSPQTYPKVFTPTEPAKYVLEVQAGFSDSVNLKVGDNIGFSQNF